MNQNPGLEQFQRAVMDRIYYPLGVGLSPAQTAWALEAFRISILPEYFRSGEPENEVSLNTQAQIVVEDILSEWQLLDAAGKWSWILHKAYGCQLLLLTRAAFTLAQARFSGTTSPQEVARQAQAVEQRLEQVVADMERFVPAVRSDLAEVISETLLDSHYARGMGENVSLRMGHVIGAAKGQ